MEGVGARMIELCQSWDTMTPCEQTCLARCWAGDRAILQLNIAAFNSDVPPRAVTAAAGLTSLKSPSSWGAAHPSPSGCISAMLCISGWETPANTD